jgi:hypothetical protein
MNGFSPMRTAKIRRLFTVLELEAQDSKPDIHAMNVAEREIMLEIKLMIQATCKRVSDQQQANAAG